MKELEIFLMTEQPVTCPWCGARTEFSMMATNLQKHVCLSGKCRKEFLVEEGE